MFIKLIGLKKQKTDTFYIKQFIDDKEYIKINNDVLNMNDSLMVYNISLNSDSRWYNNPIIEFCILSSENERLKKERLLNSLFFEVREMVRRIY